MSKEASRRLEFNDGKSSKFWEIEVADAQFTVRYGKIGTSGQTQTKEFVDAAAAAKAAEKLIAEKTGKGYQEPDPMVRIAPYKALFHEACMLARKCQHYIADNYSKSESRFELPQLEGLLRDVQRGGMAWKLDVSEKPFKDVDRRGSMLKGPFFITEEYPIPREPYDDKRLMAPIIQADLRELSKLRGLPLGDGLLQVWSVTGQWETRVIPRHVVDNDKPLPFPTDIDEFNEYWGYLMDGWMESAQYAGDPKPDEYKIVEVIDGYCDPYIDFYGNAEDSTWESFVADHEDLMEADVSEDEELEATVIEFKNPLLEGDKDEVMNQFPPPEGYERLMAIIKEMQSDALLKRRSNGSHAFGSFSPCQGSPHEVEADVLFAFEDDYFQWGSGGNAQVFFEFKDGKPEFWFTWSNWG